MVLTAFTDDTLHWRCLLIDRAGDLLSCGQEKTAHVDEVKWVTFEGIGATIELPMCDCGARMSLKADYSLRELWHATLSVKNDQGVIWAYVLKLIHVRNMRAHSRLYELGRADTAPVLALPPDGFLTHPQMATLGDVDVAHSLWYGFQAVRAHVKRLDAKKQPFLLSENARTK